MMAGWDEPIDDCRVNFCPSGEVCLSDGDGGYYCVFVYECDVDNGGCGDPAYTYCVDEFGGGATCVDVLECDFDNGGCGDPSRYFCIEVEGGDPYCEELSSTEAPPLLGTFAEFYTLEGTDGVEHCHLIYQAIDRGLADVFGGCESCSYAWDITFNLTYSSCNADNIERTLDFSMGVDMVTRQICFCLRGLGSPWEAGGRVIRK